MKKMTTIFVLVAVFLLSLVWITSQAQHVTEKQEVKKEYCKAVTKANNPCKNLVSKETNDGFCKVHSPKTPRCGVTTSSGNPCKVIVSKEGDKCHHHNKQEHGSNNSK